MKAPKVNDIEKKINIWEKPDMYLEKSKIDDMNIDYEMTRFDATIKYSKEIVNEKYKDIEKLADTFTYKHEIEQGYEKETYTDLPYIIPYLVEGSEKSVIILPGGGFAYKTIHGSVSGGKRVAELLNNNGINAFVLDYRANPYKFPVSVLDLQRAIRFVRYHKEKFNINDEKISIMGFSSGGYIVSSYINKYMGKEFFTKSYIKDDIDKISDYVNTAANIYSPFDFYGNVPMLFACFDANEVRDENTRKKLLYEMDLNNFITSQDIPQFIAYSNSDEIINYKSIEKYIINSKEKKCNISRIFVEGEKHGFSDDLYMEEYVKWYKFFND